MSYRQSGAASPAHILPAFFGALLIAIGLGAPANAQSFDCRNARHADEKAICQNSRLGELDKQLADSYDRAGSKLSKQEREEFERNETAFVNARHRCGDNAACIEQSYRNRLQELLSALPEDPSGRPERRDITKRSERQKASRDAPKTEGIQSDTGEVNREPGETATDVLKQSPGQEEAKSAAPSSSVEAHSRREEPGKTGAAALNPPSRHEAEAALAGAPPPEKQSRHKRRTESAPAGAAASIREEPPPASAPAVPERHSSKPGYTASSEKSGAAAAAERHRTATPGLAAPEKSPAIGSSTVAAEPASLPEKKHSRVKHITAGTPGSGAPSGTPASSPAPADQAKPASKPEIKWVNPAPSH